MRIQFGFLIGRKVSPLQFEASLRGIRKKIMIVLICATKVTFGGNVKPDRFGYPITIYAYDSADSIGW